jgi:hypothetical protein
MQQKQRRSRSGARVVDLPAIDLIGELLDLGWFVGQPLFRFELSNRMLSPLSLLIAGLLQEHSAFLAFSRILNPSSPKKWKYQKTQRNTNFSIFSAPKYL